MRKKKFEYPTKMITRMGEIEINWEFERDEFVGWCAVTKYVAKEKWDSVDCAAEGKRR